MNLSIHVGNHRLIATQRTRRLSAEIQSGERIRNRIGISRDNWVLLQHVWGQNWNEKMAALAKSTKSFKVILSSDKLDDYQQVYHA
ncbi:MAG: hypothetical protein ACE14P_10715 [Methanotrichaceae archaeon]